MNFISEIEQRVKKNKFTKNDIVKVYFLVLMINLMLIFNSIKEIFSISLKEFEIGSWLFWLLLFYQFISFVIITILFSFNKILYDYLSVKRIDFSLIYFLGIKKFFKTIFFVIIFNILIGIVPLLIGKSLTYFNLPILATIVLYIVESFFYTYFFMMLYIKCNNVNLSVKKIMHINKVLIKGKYIKTLIFLGVTYLPVIILFIIFKILFYLKVISIDFSGAIQIIIFIFSFRIYIREFEFFKFLKSEAIAKGTLIDTDFTEQ